MKGRIFYIDANVLVSYLIKGHPLHEEADKLLKLYEMNKFLIALSPLVVDEVLYAVRALKRKGFLEGKEERVVKALANSDFVFVNLPYWNRGVIEEVYRFMKKYHLKPRDAFHLKIMVDNSIKHLLTFDKDFNFAAESGIIEVISSF